MTIAPGRFFLIAAVVCFAIATLSAVAVVQSDTQAWEAGGLLSLSLGLLL